MSLINPLKQDRGGQLFLAILLLAVILVPTLNLLLPESSPFHLSTYTVTLLGKYLAFALLAIAVGMGLLWILQAIM